MAVFSGKSNLNFILGGLGLKLEPSIHFVLAQWFDRVTSGQTWRRTACMLARSEFMLFYICFLRCGHLSFRFARCRNIIKIEKEQCKRRKHMARSAAAQLYSKHGKVAIVIITGIKKNYSRVYKRSKPYTIAKCDLCQKNRLNLNSFIFFQKKHLH